MYTDKKNATVTKKWHIEVPTNKYGSPAAVYKVFFGKSYFIWKGKSLLQSASQLAESIERYIRMQKNDPADWIYHVCNHIKRTRCTRATIEVFGTDFIKDGTETVVDCYAMLKLEQRLLKEAEGDPLCLNNNEQAYIPKWLENDCGPDVQRFLKNWNK